MKNLKFGLLSLFILLPLFAAAQSTDKPRDKKQPAGYWQLNYGVQQSAYNYTISLETKDLEQTESKINKIAAENGLSAPNNQLQYNYNNNRNSASKMLIFNTNAAKAESFCQKVITLAKLKQYSTYTSVNDNTYNEVKKKADLINAELENNKKLFEGLPIAGSLMTDLQGRYKNYVSSYEASLDKAVISITLSSPLAPKQQD